MADACLGELGVHPRTDRATPRLGREAPAEHELDMGIGLYASHLLGCGYDV